MQLTENLINDLLSELRLNRSKFFLCKDYFEGKHDIIKNYTMQDARSNMKVVCNFPKRFITEEISYTLSNPVNYISVNNDANLTKTIDLNFSTWEKVHNIELLKQALIYGQAYEVDYLNSQGEFKAAVYTPLNMLVIEDESAEKNVFLALHLFSKNRLDKTEYLDVYIDNRIIHYKIDDGLIELGQDNHIFNSVPITICRANMESQPLMDDIKSLNDAYNNTLSDICNESCDFRNALFTITGAELEKEDVGKLKQEGVIQIPNGASVSYLIKNINDSFVQNLLSTLEKKIYQMASHIDHNQEAVANTSSLALRSRLIALENKCSLLQTMMEITIKARLKRFFEYLKVKTGVEYDYRTIKLKFTANVPQDIAVTAQIITQLQNTISQRTALSLLPFVENVDLELEQYFKEQERLGLDLDKVSAANEPE